MKVRVKLFGILGQRFTGYHHEQGMDVEIPDGARVRDLLSHLDISPSLGNIVSVDAQLMKPNDKLQNGALINIFQPVFGG
jgi:sulfur carrier protein ThiS